MIAFGSAVTQEGVKGRFILTVSVFLGTINYTIPPFPISPQTRRSEMTLKEAIESERPFKRPMYDRWLVLFQGNLYREVWFNDGKLYPQHGISEASPV
jgi:hypothetical protein